MASPAQIVDPDLLDSFDHKIRFEIVVDAHPSRDAKKEPLSAMSLGVVLDQNSSMPLRSLIIAITAKTETDPPELRGRTAPAQ